MSELPHKSETINGRDYKVYTLPLKKWAELTEFLSNILGDPISSLLNGDATIPEGVDPSLTRGDFQSMIGKLTKKITSKMIVQLTSFMGQCTHVDGAPLGSNKQDLWWAHHMADMAPAVKLFLQAQYSDFYEGLSDSLPSNVSALADRHEKESG